MIAMMILKYNIIKYIINAESVKIEMLSKEIREWFKQDADIFVQRAYG